MKLKDYEDILERARGSARVGDHKAAERLLKTYLAEHPDERDPRLLLGTVLARAERWTEALDEFLVLVSRDSNDVEALNNIAVIYKRLDRLDDALGALEQAIEAQPTRTEFHYNLGNVLKQMGDLKKAAIAYARVVELDPSYVPAYNNLGTMYDRLGEWEKAFQAFRRGLHLDRNNPTLHFNYGIALEAMGKLEDAAREYEAALRSKPGWLDAMNNLGIIHFKRGRHGEAIDIFTRILGIDPDNAEARNNMGVVLADQGRVDEAIRYYRQAIEADPSYIKAVVNLERLLENSGRLSDALIELERLVTLAPSSAEAHARLARVYLQLERFPQALEQANGALDWEPENIMALRAKGAALRALERSEEARICFERILTLDPGNYAFHLDLADLHFKRKEYAEAEKRIRAYLARKSDDRNAKLMLGKLYAETGNRTHALQVFNELVKADPSDAEALAASAELHKAAGDIEKAVRAADRLVNLQGGRATPDDLTDLNDSLVFYEQAVKDYSASTREMWDRNLKLLREVSAKAGEAEEDATLLINASVESARPVDEETETLFVEDVEALEDTQTLYETEDLFDEEASPIAEDERRAVPLDAIKDYAEESESLPIPDMDKRQADRPEPYTPPSPPPRSEPQQAPQYMPPPPQAPWPYPPPQYPPAYPPPPMPQMPPMPYPMPPPQPPLPQQQQAAPPPEPLLPLQEEPVPMPLAPDAAELPAEEPLMEETEELVGELELEEDEGSDTETEAEEEQPEPLFDEEAEEIGEGGEETEELEIEAEAECPEPEPLPAPQPAPQPAPLPAPAPAAPPVIVMQAPAPAPTPEAAPAPNPTLDLLKYLRSLAEALPGERKQSFLRSDARLKMEFLIDRMEGRPGLLREATTFVPAQPVPEKPHAASLVETLAYMSGLARALPDKNLTHALERSVGKVIGNLKDGVK